MNNSNHKVRVLFLNPAPSLIKYGMYWGMRAIGCHAYLFQGDDRIFDKPQDIQMKRIKEVVEKERINIIFCEGYAGMPYMDIYQYCQDKGIQFHFWDIESPVTPQIGQTLIHHCDYMWTTCIETIPYYESQNKKSGLLLFGCNPEFHIPVPSEKIFQHDISLVGTNYDNRYDKIKEFIYPLIDHKFDMMVYGYWWMEKNREVNLCNHPELYWHDKDFLCLPYEWLPRVINSSKIMIGVNCSDLSTTQTSCRPYETLCCSNTSVYLAWYTKAQNTLFGDYIYQARNGQEMVDMANEILSMTDEQRKKIATEARNYVIDHHSYTLRAQQVADAFNNNI